MKKRILNILLLLVFLVVILRMCYLMFYMGEYYKQKLLEKNNQIIYGNSAPRGRILDRNGVIIVDNIGIKTIIYNKLNGVSEKDEIDVSLRLGDVLDIEYGTIDEQKYFYYINNKEKVNDMISDKVYNEFKERKISSTELLEKKLDLININMLDSLSSNEKKASKIYSLMNSGYSYQDKVIKKDCSDIEYATILEMNLIGIKTELTFERINNYENVLNEVIGTVGKIQKNDLNKYMKLGYSISDVVGTSYLERYYEEYLKGEKAEYRVNNDNTLTKIKDEVQGNDLVLNIDINIQTSIEKLLESEIIKAKEFKSSRFYNGSYIIISDPNTGGIVSMVGKSFNNGKFYNNEIGIINKSYTVGSVVKAATISLGYKYNVIDIGSSVVDSCVKLKNKTEKCSWRKLGRINDLDALALSSNYYQFLIAIGLTGESYKYNMGLNNLDYAFKIYRKNLASFGLGVKTGIDLENESIGIIGNTVSDDLLLNLSIGQYDTYTPIELTQYINTVANNGERIELSLMKEIVSPEGKVILRNDSKVLNKVDLEDKYMERIKEGLRKVSISGTGSYYIDSKYKASSKTGTSESLLDSDLDGKGDVFTTTRSFISYMPSDEPIYSMVIVSPNIEYKENEKMATYSINTYLARNISKILFDN